MAISKQFNIFAKINNMSGVKNGHRGRPQSGEGKENEYMRISIAVPLSLIKKMGREVVSNELHLSLLGKINQLTLGKNK